ncbi:MAG: hypothetical protein IIC00_11500 [Planctomycetes bacterium]|nr:hypothetical protein [Planctomycetota bacterium]
MLGGVAGLLAKLDAERALEIAEAIEHADVKTLTMADIATQLAYVNVDRALQVAKGITDSRAIGAETAVSEVEKAEEIFLKNRLNSIRAETLGHIAIRLAKMDVERALQLAEGIKNAQLKRLTLYFMVIQLTTVDVEGALQVAEAVQALARPSGTPVRLHLARLHTDMESAMQGMGMFTLPLGLQIEAHCESLCVFQKLHFELGISTPITEVYDTLNSMALVPLVQKLAKVDKRRALTLARGIEYPGAKAEALAKLAVALSEGR